MVRTTRLIAVACAVLTAQLFGVHAGAAVPVVESQGSAGTRAPGTTASPSASSSGVRSYGADQNQAGAIAIASDTPQSGPVGQSSTSEMFLRFQQLEADVAELRGIVEEQSHQIERLEQQQKEQYLDLDRRIALLLKGQPSAGTSTGGPGGTIGGPVADGGATEQTTTGSPPGSPTGSPTGSQGGGERDAYTAAFELTKQKRFNDAINAFNQMLVMYPKGQYTGNAYYWLGELYFALPEPNLEKSRQSFTQVVTLYPTNQKVSDAMYKLGVVYHQLGDKTKALEYLKRVQSQFPGTPAARLAQSYAAELH
jgi:tol-pal system protein YbgF